MSLSISMSYITYKSSSEAHYSETGGTFCTLGYKVQSLNRFPHPKLDMFCPKCQREFWASYYDGGWKRSSESGLSCLQLTQKKQKMEYKALDQILQTYEKETGEKKAITYRCGDMDRIVPSLMGVSKVVLLLSIT